MGRLEGKITLVTGAGNARGLGAATAERFAQEGAFVYLTDIDLDGAEGVAKTIRDNGGMAEAHAQDVSKEADWDALFEKIRKGHGRLDTIVNNAGIAILKPITDLTAADWDKQNRINLDSVFYGTQRAVALMRETGGGGSIINLSSMAGSVGVFGCGAYGAAKGGVRTFSKVVAIECAAEGIRCNSVHPGMIETAMQDVARRDNPDVFKEIVAGIPMKKMGTPEDIANMNLFLASDESAYVTGAELVVDGGATAM